MKTPAFWNDTNLLSTLLLPFSACYALLRRKQGGGVSVGVPVICIGNLTAGGAGKTPTALAIGQRLKEKNIHAFFLSRGYGGRLRGPVLVDAKTHSARDVGDEPLLLARTLPTIIAKDRLAGARFAVAQGAKMIIMDDGFQNPSIAKNLSLLVIDGASGLGNGRLLPAGPLRETPGEGFARADAVIVIGETRAGFPLPADRPVLAANIEPVASALALKDKKVFAFCGIAYPQKFFTLLESFGAHVTNTASFGDHHHYKTQEIDTLAARAAAHNALLVTTAKDAVRLPKEVRRLVTVVDIELRFEEAGALEILLDSLSLVIPAKAGILTHLQDPCLRRDDKVEIC